MLDGPAITKQLASNNEKHQLTALLNVSNFLNSTDAKDLPLMLVPALETLLRGGDMPTKHRVLMYGMARRSSALHSALLAAIISDLEDTTVNDPACLSAAASSLPILPIEEVLNFFARPGNEDGSYSCEESAEVINRCLGHEDARVRCGTVPGLTKAAIRAYGAVHGTEGLQNHGSCRAHESWAAAVRFRDVVHDHVGELLSKLSSLVADDSDERVVAIAASSLHNTMKGAVLVGSIRHEGDECWDLDGTHFLLIDVMRGIDERALIGGEWAHFTVQAARSLFDLTQKVLGAKETKLNQLVQRTLQSSPGASSHPALLRLGSDLMLLRLYLTSRPEYHPKTAASAAQHWAGTMLAREVRGDNSLWEDALVGNSELLRLLHLPCLRHMRGLLANSVFETSMHCTRGALVQKSIGKELDVAYRPQLYHHISTELLSSEDISLVSCAITALPWCSHTHLFPSRFARCLRLICLIEELPVRCGLLSALTATLMTDPTSGVRPASSISAALGSSQALDILQDRAPRKLSSELDTAQLRHELATALLKASAHSLSTRPARAVVFRVDALSSTRDRLECLRWAEGASVLLTQEFRGWKLSECLSWPCADVDSTDALFPSAAAPLSFLKLMALVFTACNRARLVKFDSTPHMSVDDEAEVRSQVTSLQQSIDALQTRDTAAKSAGEAEISEALQSTLAGEEMKRNELLRNLRSPKEQWTSGWAVVSEDMWKLSRDLVVWTLGRGIKDRGVRVSLLALLADQWTLLTEKRESTHADTASGTNTPARCGVSQGRDGTPDPHGGRWDTDSFGRSQSAGRSDMESMSQGGSSFEECDDMSFSESALCEDLARELIRELSRVEPSIKHSISDTETSIGLIGGGTCLRAIAPPSASLAYHQALIAASLRLAKTCPQTAPVFLSAFTSRILSARCAHRIASEVAPTLSGFQDTCSELEPLIHLLSVACSELMRLSPQSDAMSLSGQLSVGGKVVTEGVTQALGGSPSMDFFAASFNTVPVSTSFTTPAVYTTPPRPEAPSAEIPESTHSLELMQFVMAICERGYSFGERFWHSKGDAYGSTLVAVFENQFNRRGGGESGENESLLSKTVGGCGDPLVGNLSVRVSPRGLTVQLALINTTACSLVGVGGRVSGGSEHCVDTLPSGATVRFQWDLALTVRSVTTQVYFRSLELEANSDSEEEAEKDAFDEGEDDALDNDFGGDGGGGGGVDNVPSLVRSFLPPTRLQVPASSLLTAAHFSPDAFLSTWPHLPYSGHVHALASDERAITSLVALHRTALVPSVETSSTSMQIHSYAWMQGKVVVGLVLSAVLCEDSEVREALGMLDEVRKKLNMDAALPHNDALLEAVRITGVLPSSDPDLLVRRVATALNLDTRSYGTARWVLDMEVRCDDLELLNELVKGSGSDWLKFLGSGLSVHQKVPITLAKDIKEKRTCKSMAAEWRKLREERAIKGY